MLPREEAFPFVAGSRALNEDCLSLVALDAFSAEPPVDDPFLGLDCGGLVMLLREDDRPAE